MKKLITHIILFFFFISYSQNNEDYKTDIDFSYKEEIDSILTESFIKYKIDHIELIKISPKCDTIYNVDGSKTLGDCINLTIIKKNSPQKIELEKQLIENKTTINKSESIIILKKLYSQKINIKEYSETSCYSPNHGIKFLDSNKSIIGFLEICFDCENYRAIGKIPQLIIQSTSQFDMLRQIFKKYEMIE